MKSKHQTLHKSYKTSKKQFFFIIYFGVSFEFYQKPKKVKLQNDTIIMHLVFFEPQILVIDPAIMLLS